MSKIITFSYLESFLEDCVKINVVFQQIFRLFFSSFAYLFFPIVQNHIILCHILYMYFDVIYHLILFHITSKYIVWYISDHIYSNVLCQKTKLQYVTFYYINKKKIISSLVAPGNIVVMVQTKTHYTWRHKAPESTSSLPRSHHGPSPSFTGSL